MRHLISILSGAIVFLLMWAFILGAQVGPPKPAFAEQETAISTVMVVTMTGHGSGVHIGDGFFLTAAHVVGADDPGSVSVKDQFNRVSPAKLMWSNPGADVALLRVDPEFLHVKTSALACSEPPPAIGDQIQAVGNPFSLRSITTKGYVSGDNMEMSNRIVTPLSLSVLPGMSGGPALDDNGKIVGLVIAYVTSLTNSPMVRGWSDFSMMVPRSVICELLAR